jgi:hypothetical protein
VKAFGFGIPRISVTGEGGGGGKSSTTAMVMLPSFNSVTFPAPIFPLEGWGSRVII